MIDLLAKKSTQGELSLNLAKQRLQSHEWGLAKQEVENALAKGGLLDADVALALHREVCSRLGMHKEV